MTIDYYKILGLENTATSSDIKKAYLRLLKIYHPDKIKDNDKTKLDMYNQIKEAHNVLSDPQKKRTYDNGKSSNYMQSHDACKNDFAEFIKAQEASKSKQDEEAAKLEWDRFNEDMKKKESKLSSDEMERKMNDLLMQRELQSLEFEESNPNYFVDREFDVKEFNKRYKLLNGNKSQSMDIVNYDDIQPFDAFIESNFNNEVNYDERESVNSEEIENMVNSDDEINKITEDDIEKYRLQREKDDDMIRQMNYDDYKNVKFNKNSISGQLGYMIGNNFGGMDSEYLTLDHCVGKS